MKRGHGVRIGVLAALAAASMAQAQSNDPAALRGDFGGSWYDPQQPGQGVQVEILDGGKAVVAWYTFDAEGRTLWLSGLGTVDGNTIQANLQRSTGGRFPGSGTGTATQQPWGAVTLTFADCGTGTLAWTPTATGFSAGTAPLQRLTSAHGARCNGEEAFGQQIVYSFQRDMQGFTAVFADLPPTGQDIYELDYRRELLPVPLEARSGLRLTGHNRSDDLAMLVKAPVRGLLPNRDYDVELDVEIASDVPSGCSGIGGSPGESVFVKLGAAGQEPRAELSGDALRLNIDYGVQGGDGANAVVVGDMALDTQECDDPNGTWELKTLTTRDAESQLRVRTDANGTLWVLAGTDSGFEGLTQYYVTSLRVRLQPVAGQ